MDDLQPHVINMEMLVAEIIDFAVSSHSQGGVVSLGAIINGVMRNHPEPNWDNAEQRTFYRDAVILLLGILICNNLPDKWENRVIERRGQKEEVLIIPPEDLVRYRRH